MPASFKMRIWHLPGRGTTRPLCLRDQEEAIQRKLLSEADMDLSKTVQVDSTMEEAHANALSLLAPASTVAQVDSLQITDTSRPQPSQCTRCGHPPCGCWARDLTCHHCKKKGHLSRVCHSVRGRSTRNPTHCTYQIEAEQEEEDLISTVYAVKTTRLADPYKATLQVNGKPEIDKGAVVSLILIKPEKPCFCRQDCTSQN